MLRIKKIWCVLPLKKLLFIEWLITRVILKIIVILSMKIRACDIDLKDADTFSSLIKEPEQLFHKSLIFAVENNTRRVFNNLHL